VSVKADRLVRTAVLQYYLVSAQGHLLHRRIRHIMLEWREHNSSRRVGGDQNEELTNGSIHHTIRYAAVHALEGSSQNSCRNNRESMPAIKANPSRRPHIVKSVLRSAGREDWCARLRATGGEVQAFASDRSRVLLKGSAVIPVSKAVAGCHQAEEPDPPDGDFTIEKMAAA
jgi:hypothetical protein